MEPNSEEETPQEPTKIERSIVWDKLGQILLWPFIFGDLATFVYLTFFDGYIYNAWNWIIAIPVNAFLATIWPIFWLLRLLGIG